MANFGPLSRGQPHSSVVNHCVLHFRPKGHQEPHNKVGSQILAKHLVGFEQGTFQLLQCLNPLGHPQKFSFANAVLIQVKWLLQHMILVMILFGAC